MSKMPVPPSYAETENRWALKGGISPPSVIRSVEGDVAGAAFKIYPAIKDTFRDSLERDYPGIEFKAAVLGLEYMDTNRGRVGDWPVLFSDVCSGPFAGLIDSLYFYMEHADAIPPVDALEYMRFLGRHVVAKMQSRGLITPIHIPGDGYTPETGYLIEEKGKSLLDAYRKQDFASLKGFMEIWSE